MKSKFSRLLKIILLLALVSGAAGLSFTVMSRHLRTQEKAKLEQVRNLLERKKYAEAIAVYDQLLENDVAQAHLLWINRGYAWSALEQYEPMLKSCLKATQVDPQSALAWNCHGEALYYLDRYQAALASFEQAIAIDPTAVFWLNKSRVFAELEDYNQAVAASEQGIKLLTKSARKSDNPNIAIAYTQQGENWLELQENKQALIAFNQSIEYLRTYLPAQQGQAVALYRLGFYDEAVEVLANILQRDDLTQKQQAINWLYKGISLCETSKAKTAEKSFAQVLQLTIDPQILAIAKAGCGIR